MKWSITIKQKKKKKEFSIFIDTKLNSQIFPPTEFLQKESISLRSVASGFVPECNQNSHLLLAINLKIKVWILAFNNFLLITHNSFIHS